MKAKRLHLNRRVDWALLTQVFPDYANHIKRIRNSQKKLMALRQRLVTKYGWKREKLVTS